MSRFERRGIATIFFALLLSVGGAIAFGFFLNDSSQSSKSDLIRVSGDHLRSDKTNVVVDTNRQLGTTVVFRSNSKTDNVHAAATLLNTEEDSSEPSTPEEQPNTIEAVGAPQLEPTVVPDIRQRTSAPSHAADGKTSKRSKIASRPSEPCRSATCQQALAECTQLCDAAMNMAVASCPRVSAGASPQDEKGCLTKRDRSRRNCHSGCALRQSQANAN
jgi:hypothetical protein